LTSKQMFYLIARCGPVLLAQMRVLFLGQTGISKRSCVERLARHCLLASGFSGDLENIRAMEHLRVFHLEDYIGKLSAGDYISYLDQFNTKRQQDIWAQAWDAVSAEISSGQPTHIFITLHATYFRKNRFFTVASIDRLRNFNPDVIVTLIDDVYECWHRIQVRESEQPRGTNLRLRDVLLWRTVEIMMGDFLVHGAGIQHYELATKHPAEMVRRLIFEPARKRVYASFPITSTRQDDAIREEIDSFRGRLHEQFTVFDPLTIDERILLLALKAHKERKDQGGSVVLGLEDRWSPWFSSDLEPMAEPYDANYPLSVPVDQIEEVGEDIDRQIESRDYRLIDSVQAVAAFRPNFGGHHSRGVNSELLYASQSAGIPVHLSWDEQEDGIYGDSPFSVVGTRHSNVSDLVAALVA